MSSAASVDADATLRLFLALDLPPAERGALAAWAREVRPGGRLVSEHDLHITLAFLGSRPAGDLAVIRGALEEAVAAHPVAPLIVRSWRTTQSVGMLVLDDPQGGASRLREALRGRLVELGIPPSGPEPWLPHVTVVRQRERSVARVVPPAGRTLVPSDAAAYLSRLSPTGARYTALARLPLHRTTEEDMG